MTRVSFVLLIAACGGGKPAGSPVEPASAAVAPPPSNGQASVGPGCITTGCSGSICIEQGFDQMTTCEMKPEYACYQGAECKVQDNGKCGWTMDDRMQKCLASPPAMQ
jgi:hypothetical protein